MTNPVTDPVTDTVNDTVADTAARPGTGGRIGDNAARPDGIPKVRGEFAFTGDMWADGSRSKNEAGTDEGVVDKH